MSETRLQERLLTSTVKKESGCWEWTGQISNTGHGRTMIREDSGKTRIVSAEYASYRAFVGGIPGGQLVRQTCGNRLCINPEHLEVFDPSAQGSAFITVR